MIEREEELRAHGWQRDVSGVWTRPAAAASAHAHSAACTRESCGESALFFCPGPTCLRALRREGERRRCPGHGLPSRAALIEHALRRKDKAAAAPVGTPLEDDEPANTWSSEREGTS